MNPDCCSCIQLTGSLNLLSLIVTTRAGQSSPEVLQVPLFVYYKGPGFNDSNSYYEENCRPTPSEPQSLQGQALKRGRIRHHVPNERPSLKHKELEKAQFESVGFTSLSNETEDVQVSMASCISPFHLPPIEYGHPFFFFFPIFLLFFRFTFLMTM